MGTRPKRRLQINAGDDKIGVGDSVANNYVMNKKKYYTEYGSQLIN